MRATVLSAGGPPILQVSGHDPFARTAVSTIADTVTIDVTSPSGIGHASFTLPPKRRPARILIRLHLKGLEEFRFVYGDTMIVVNTDARIPRMSDVRAHLRVIDQPGGEGREIRELSPFDPEFIQVTISSALGYPTGTGADWLVVEAPPSFLHGDEDRFEIRWIDFYR